jgi:uncharacterized protein DUF4440
MRRIRPALIASLLALALALAPAALGAQPATKPAPKLSAPVKTARSLVTRFFTLVERKDVAGLRSFLSPAFQIQRADGSSANKAQYLKKLPDVMSFRLSRFVASQAGPVLVTRYLSDTTGTVNGKPFTPGNAPRLSVFVWNGRAWQLAAHANFNPLTG